MIFEELKNPSVTGLDDLIVAAQLLLLHVVQFSEEDRATMAEIFTRLRNVSRSNGKSDKIDTWFTENVLKLLEEDRKRDSAR